MTKKITDRYFFVAKAYEFLAKIASRNQIFESKKYQLDFVQPDQKVLYAGAGAGEDAFICALKEAKVTAIDRSAAMLALSEKKFASIAARHSVEIIQSDILKHTKQGYYDVVIANYFLNVFDQNSMVEILSHLVKLTKPGGKIMIADFAPAEGGVIKRFTQLAYWYLALIFFCMVTGNAFHNIYDYSKILPPLDLELEHSKDFAVTSFGPTFRTYVCSRGLPLSGN